MNGEETQSDCIDKILGIKLASTPLTNYRFKKGSEVIGIRGFMFAVLFQRHGLFETLWRLLDLLLLPLSLRRFELLLLSFLTSRLRRALQSTNLLRF